MMAFMPPMDADEVRRTRERMERRRDELSLRREEIAEVLDEGRRIDLEMRHIETIIRALVGIESGTMEEVALAEGVATFRAKRARRLRHIDRIMEIIESASRPLTAEELHAEFVRRFPETPATLKLVQTVVGAWAEPKGWVKQYGPDGRMRYGKAAPATAGGFQRRNVPLDLGPAPEFPAPRVRRSSHQPEGGDGTAT
jgi:hypothetical protein